MREWKDIASELSALIHIPILFSLGCKVFKSWDVAAGMTLPYVAYYSASKAAAQEGTYKRNLAGFIALFVLVFALYMVFRPESFFRQIGVPPDVHSSASIRLRMKRLGPQASPEVVEMAKLLLNDTERRKYIYFGPSRLENWEGLASWYVACFLFIASVASRRGAGGEGTLLFGVTLLVCLVILELAEKHSVVPFIKLSSFPLLCTYELFDIFHLWTMGLAFSLYIYHLRATFYEHQSLPILHRLFVLNQTLLRKLEGKQE